MRSGEEQMMRRQGRDAGECVRCIMTGKMPDVGCNSGFGSAHIVPDEVCCLEDTCRVEPDCLAENKRIIARGSDPLCDPSEVHLPRRRIEDELIAEAAGKVLQKVRKMTCRCPPIVAPTVMIREFIANTPKGM